MADNHIHQEKIKKIIAECSSRDHTLIDDNSWLDIDLYIDSLILTDIVYALEEAFHIRIVDDDMAGVNQVADVYRLVRRKLALQ